MSFDTDDILEVRDLEPPADSLPPKRFREGLHNYGGVRYFIGRHPPPSCPRGGGDDDDEDEVLTHPLNTYSQPLLTQLINTHSQRPLSTHPLNTPSQHNTPSNTTPSNQLCAIYRTTRMKMKMKMNLDITPTDTTQKGFTRAKCSGHRNRTSIMGYEPMNWRKKG